MKDEKENMSLVDRVACRRGIRRGLPAVLTTLAHDSGDIKALWSQSVYRYVLPYIVDNAARHDTSGEKG